MIDKQYKPILLLNESINEELGVADLVVKEKSNLVDIIYKKLQQMDFVKLAPGLSRGLTSFEHKMFNKIKYTVVIAAYTFGDVNIYENYFNKLKINSNSTDINNKILVIFLPIVNNRINWNEFQDPIQHELSHIYEHSYNNASIGDMELYNKAVNNLNNPDNYIKIIATLIYYSNQHEQTAFCNGLYAFLMEFGDRFSVKNVETLKLKSMDSDAYAIYQMFFDVKKTLEDWDDNDANCISALSMFGLTLNKLKKMCNKACKQFSRRLGRTIVKAYQDIEIKKGTLL